MNTVRTWYGSVNEDGSFSILARLTSLDGSGVEVEAGEGNLLQQADVSSITCKVIDLGTNRDAESGDEVLPASGVSVATSIFDTLRTTGWPHDLHGYNFRHDLGAIYTETGGEWRLIEYKITLTSGGIAWLKVRVKIDPVQTS